MSSRNPNGDAEEAIRCASLESKKVIWPRDKKFVIFSVYMIKP